MNARNINFIISNENDPALIDVEPEIFVDEDMAEFQDSQYIENPETDIIFDLIGNDQSNAAKEDYNSLMWNLVKNFKELFPNIAIESQEVYNLGSDLIEFLREQGYRLVIKDLDDFEEIQIYVEFSNDLLPDLVSDNIGAFYVHFELEGFEAEGSLENSQLFDNFIKYNNRHVIFSEDATVNAYKEIYTDIGSEYLSLIKEVNNHLFDKINMSKKEVYLADMVVRFFEEKGCGFAIMGDSGLRINLDKNDRVSVTEYIQSDILDTGKEKSVDERSDNFLKFIEKNKNVLNYKCNDNLIDLNNDAIMPSILFR